MLKREGRKKNIIKLLVVVMITWKIMLIQAGIPPIIINQHNISQLNNDAGFLSSFVESDPKWTANITNYFTKAEWNATNTTYLRVDQWNSTNSSYALNQTLVDMWLPFLNTTNITYDAFNSTGLIRDWNVSGHIFDWNGTGYIVNWSNIVSLTETDSKAYNGTLAYNSTLTSMWNLFLNITNLTYLRIDQWNATNTTYLRVDQWNATNTSYYLKENPFGYYNSTNPQPITDVWVNSSGDTMTGNLNMSDKNITFANGTTGGRICLTQSCSSFMMHNGTGVLIRSG